MKHNKILSCTLIAALLMGLCSCSGNTASTEETHNSAPEAPVNVGIEQVELKVWAEEAAVDTLNKIIDSFKQEHAGAVMNKRGTIVPAILIPVFILGLVSIMSNLILTQNIRSVNNSASEIADNYMVSGFCIDN